MYSSNVFHVCVIAPSTVAIRTAIAAGKYKWLSLTGPGVVTTLAVADNEYPPAIISVQRCGALVSRIRGSPFVSYTYHYCAINDVDEYALH